MPSEVQILIIAIVFAPLMAWTYRGMEMPGKPWLAGALIAVFCGYVFTVAEGYALFGFVPTAAQPDNPAFNALEHIAYLVAAVCFVISSTDFLKTKSWLEGGQGR